MTTVEKKQKQTQSRLPGMQRARSVERNENTSISSGVTDTSDNFRSCNPGVFNSGVQSPDTQQRHVLRAHRRVRVLWSSGARGSRFDQSEPSSRHAPLTV